MGGFVFDDSKSDERIFPPNVDRLTLSPRLIVWCLEHDYSDLIPHITESDIKDKSKVNSLVKGFTYLRFVTRMAQNLPVSLLELNTFAHSICALLIYFLWWEKPLDIDEPIVIPVDRSADTRSLAAWAAVHSGLGFHELYIPNKWRFVRNICKHSPAKSWKKQQTLTDLHFFRPSPSDQSWIDRVYFGAPVRLCQPTIERLPGLASSRPGSGPFPLSFLGLDDLGNCELVSDNPPILRLHRGMRLPRTSFHSMMESSEVEESLLARLKGSVRVENPPSGALADIDNFMCSPLSTRIRNFGEGTTVAKEHLEKLSNYTTFSGEQILTAIMAGLCYGGLHALAFGVPLRSKAETLCWQISSLTIASFGPFMVCVSSLMMLNKRFYAPRGPKKILNLCLHELTLSIELACLTLYVLSRVFLVVEIFLSLPYVDPGVYRTPN